MTQSGLPDIAVVDSVESTIDPNPIISVFSRPISDLHLTPVPSESFGGGYVEPSVVGGSVELIGAKSIISVPSCDQNAKIALSKRGRTYYGQVDKDGYPVEFEPTAYFEEKFMDQETYNSKKLRIHLIELPSNVWAALMVLPQCQLSTNPYYDYMLKLQLGFVWFVNFIVQGSMVWYVREITSSQAEDPEVFECHAHENKADTYLRNICILIFVCMVLADLGETWMMHQWYQAMTPTLEWCERLFGNAYKIVNQDYETKDPDTLDIANSITKLNNFQYYFIWIFVIGAKYALGIYIILFGTGFIVTTSDDMDIILNSVALLFIVETDELVYEYFMSIEMKELFEKAPRILVAGDHERHPFTIFMKSTVTLIITCVVLYSYCGSQMFG